MIERRAEIKRSSDRLSSWNKLSAWSSDFDILLLSMSIQSGMSERRMIELNILSVTEARSYASFGVKIRCTVLHNKILVWVQVPLVIVLTYAVIFRALSSIEHVELGRSLWSNWVAISLFKFRRWWLKHMITKNESLRCSRDIQEVCGVHR
jgi:hypothetical protein